MKKQSDPHQKGSVVPLGATGTPRVVFVSLKFFTIENIDILEHSFTAEIFINASWRDETVTATVDKEFDKTNQWTPHIRCGNIRVMKSRERWYRVDAPVGSKSTRINERSRIKAEFNERFELRKFPFDIQDLKIVVTTTEGLQGVVLSHRLDPHARRASTFDTADFIHADTWRIRNPNIVFHPQMTRSFYSATGAQYCELVGYVRLQRYASYFVRQFMIPACLISVTPVTTYWLEDASAKLSVTLTMVLTMFAFRFASTSTLPVISYSTFLDKYLQNAMFFLFAIIALNVLTAEVEATAGWAELSAYSLWFLYHGHVAYELNSLIKLENAQKESPRIRDWAATNRVGPEEVLKALRIPGKRLVEAHESAEDMYAREVKARTCGVTGRLEIGTSMDKTTKLV